MFQAQTPQRLLANSTIKPSSGGYCFLALGQWHQQRRTSRTVAANLFITSSTTVTFEGLAVHCSGGRHLLTIETKVTPTTEHCAAYNGFGRFIKSCHHCLQHTCHSRPWSRQQASMAGGSLLRAFPSVEEMCLHRKSPRALNLHTRYWPAYRPLWRPPCRPILSGVCFTTAPRLFTTRIFLTGQAIILRYLKPAP